MFKKSHVRFIESVSVLLVALSCISQLAGCATDSYAAKGAAKGATTGAAAGAVGGLVSALVFGGDPLDRAARGAVYGGAAGATAGAMAGSEMDRQVEEDIDQALAVQIVEAIALPAVDDEIDPGVLPERRLVRVPVGLGRFEKL